MGRDVVASVLVDVDVSSPRSTRGVKVLVSRCSDVPVNVPFLRPAVNTKPLSRASSSAVSRTISLCQPCVSSLRRGAVRFLRRRYWGGGGGSGAWRRCGGGAALFDRCVEPWPGRAGLQHLSTPIRWYSD